MLLKMDSTTDILIYQLHSISFQVHSPKLSQESYFTLSFDYAGLFKEQTMKQTTDNFQCRAP